MASLRSFRTRALVTAVATALTGHRLANREAGATQLRQTVARNLVATAGTVLGSALGARSRRA